MKYLCLIYEDRELGKTLPKADIEKAKQDYRTFTDNLKQNGQYVTGNMLDTQATKTVRASNGTPLAKDGPVVQTKDQLGGYYIIEAYDLNEAVKIAGRIPSAKWGAVEVRPVAEMHAA